MGVGRGRGRPLAKGDDMGKVSAGATVPVDSCAAMLPGWPNGRGRQMAVVEQMTDEESSYHTRHRELCDDLDKIGGHPLSNRVDEFIGETMAMYQNRGIDMGKDELRKALAPEVDGLCDTVRGMQADVDPLRQERAGVSK